MWIVLYLWVQVWRAVIIALRADVWQVIQFRSDTNVAKSFSNPTVYIMSVIMMWSLAITIFASLYRGLRSHISVSVTHVISAGIVISAFFHCSTTISSESVAVLFSQGMIQKLPDVHASRKSNTSNKCLILRSPLVMLCCRKGWLHAFLKTKIEI